MWPSRLQFEMKWLLLSSATEIKGLKLGKPLWAGAGAGQSQAWGCACVCLWVLLCLRDLPMLWGCACVCLWVLLCLGDLPMV